MAIPAHSPYIIIGAGIHGLSTAYHLALQLKATGKGDGRDIVILDKSGICSGATGIACGVIRNNYFQPAMRELMAHSVNIWESDPETYSYHPVGYMQISCESMREDVAAIHAQQQAIGYESVFIEGAVESERYMKGLFSDWRAQGITSVLHEMPGGYANNSRAMYGLAAKAEALGVRIISGITVKALESDNSRAITAVDTDRGRIECDYAVIAAGPWVRSFWEMLELPMEVSIRNPATREVTEGSPCDLLVTTGRHAGRGPQTSGHQRRRHAARDSCGYRCAAVLRRGWATDYRSTVGHLLQARLPFWWRAGGAAPFIVDKPAADVAVDPYGPASPEFVVGAEFAEMWVSALAHCQERFSGTLPQFKKEPSGGIGAFTPDSFPVFDTMRENCFVIADSNHGYKMIGVGELVAQTVCGDKPGLLGPFRFSRYAEGDLHPVSNSPFPWS